MTGPETSKSDAGARAPRRHGMLALALAGLVAGMVGLSFAAVPLYRIFCQVTGFAGTTQRAVKAPEKVLARKIKVRFDGNVAKGMPWRFHPVQNSVDLKIGESTLAFYKAENLSNKPVRGTATFNVTPEQAGYYFNKIECFCFTEQTLAPGQSADMPVTFFIDPEIVDDPDARNITEITLSYTFFPVEGGADVAAHGRGGSEKDSKGG
jgi:cytochrome c oxidase assembly protein subunit 11